MSHLKERQVSEGVDGVQRAAVVVSGRIDLSTLKDGDVQREPVVSPLRSRVAGCLPHRLVDGVAQPLDFAKSLVGFASGGI